jgi:6-phosphogluconolactonase
MTGASQANLRVGANAQEAADLCAEHILHSLAVTLKSKSSVTIAISGGSTPKLLFGSMAKASFDWSNVHFFWVDERCVPPTDNLSNFKLANEALFKPAEIAAANIHRVFGELPPSEAAARYTADIQQFFSLQEGAIPVFDIIHRGMGSDAHTASLFPGEPLIADRTGIAAAVWSEPAQNYRVTLLPAVLLAAKETVILAAGEDKAGPLHNVLEGPDDPFRFPSQLGTRGAANAVWFLDRAAAGKL